MKNEIFNSYVDFICRELNVRRKQLFRKNRTARISTARFLLYALCYHRPMTIGQIVDLMADNGHKIARQGVEYGIQKLNSSVDVDVDTFIRKGLYECSLENQFDNRTNKESLAGISIYPNPNQTLKAKDATALSNALKLLREDYKEGVFNKEEYKEERLRLINKIGKDS